MARIRFDRHELSGAFGDIGTDLPLLVGLIPAAGFDSASVFIIFGLFQMLSGVLYGLPMPMQPLKAMAVIVIGAAATSNAIKANVVHGAGLAIGIIMIALSLSGALALIAKWIPKCVVRGIQFGLGLLLAQLALGNYVHTHGWQGYALAAAAFAVVILLGAHQRWPAGLIVIALGIIYALFRMNFSEIAEGVGLGHPKFTPPTWDDISAGFVLLALPQLPLSLANSVIATKQTVHDLFPERPVTVRGIGLTYGITNLIAAFFGGIPVCHGCGGLAGHYAFGARTGGSVIIYGSVYLTIGLLFGRVFDRVVEIFPKPILGVVLLVEALVLLRFISDQAASPRAFWIALLVAVFAFAIPTHGFVIGLLVGTTLYYLQPTDGNKLKG
jgi:MFS superfamily sulfate permease-like transporter